MALKLPQTLVLLATTHGGMLVDEVVENNEKVKKVQTFVVPRGFSITRYMATRPGVCNMTTEDQIDTIVKTMNRDPGQTVPTIKTTQAEVVKSVETMLKDNEGDLDLVREYLRGRISNPTLKEFKAGDTLVDKYLTRSDEENTGVAFDFKLNLLNVSGVPDLFDLMKFGSTGPAVRTRAKKEGDVDTQLSELVTAIRALGVKRLVLYDLTCSSFMREPPITDAEARILRRSIIQEGLGKRKTRRTNTKTKTRKQKKRRALWSH